MSAAHRLVGSCAALVLGGALVGAVREPGWVSGLGQPDLRALRTEPLASGPVAGLRETARTESRESSGWPLDMPTTAGITRHFAVGSMTRCQAALPVALAEARAAGWEPKFPRSATPEVFHTRWIDGAGESTLSLSCERSLEEPREVALLVWLVPY